MMDNLGGRVGGWLSHHKCRTCKRRLWAITIQTTDDDIVVMLICSRCDRASERYAPPPAPAPPKESGRYARLSNESARLRAIEEAAREVVRRATTKPSHRDPGADTYEDWLKDGIAALRAALSTTPAPAVTYEVVAAAIRAVGLPYIESKAREGEVDWIAGRLTDALTAALDRSTPHE